MKSVGEAMAIGRTFKEALQKALRSAGDQTLRSMRRWQRINDVDAETLALETRDPERGTDFPSCPSLSGRNVDRRSFRTDQDRPLVFAEPGGDRDGTQCLKTKDLLRAKKLGFSDRQLAVANGVTETEIRAKRQSAA